MALCPKDYKPCIDDICHGAGCIRLNGEQMIDVCSICDEPIDDLTGCECDRQRELSQQFDDDDTVNAPREVGE